jgi:hypothetical protein
MRYLPRYQSPSNTYLIDSKGIVVQLFEPFQEMSECTPLNIAVNLHIHSKAGHLLCVKVFMICVKLFLG